MPRIPLLLVGIVLKLTAANEDCQKFLASQPQPIKSYFFGSKNHGFFSQFVTKDGDYELKNVIKYQVISTLYENKTKAALCVGFVDTTSYTKNLRTGSEGAIGWATLNTDAAIPTGIVEVDGECWTLQKDLVPCSPVFFPMLGVMETPLYVHSPLSEKFWLRLNDEELFATNWVWRMNTMSKEEKIPSSWVSNIMIRSLKELQIIGNDWRRVETLLSPLPILQRLDLTDNNIQELSPDVLVNTPRLRDLLLARNNLSTFPQKLDQLDSLRLLDITNPKGNAVLTISTADLSTIGGVEIFGLENINLNADVTGLLSLQKLKFLNLSGCRIYRIDDISSEMEVNVRENSLAFLDLSKNELSSLPNKLFSTLKNLKALRLQRNNLENCPKLVLEHLHELDYLDLSNNLITGLSWYCFRNASRKLEYLDLSRNKISYMSGSAFQNLNSLKTLKLSGNKLTMIYSQTFSGNNIQALDISHNLLSEWHVDVIINNLNISFNNITKFSTETFDNFNRSNEIDLGGNPFSCCDVNLTLLMKWMRSTSVNINNLGTKDLLECSVPEGNQKYPILNFKYAQDLCIIENSPIFVLIEDSDVWNVTTMVVVTGILLAIILIIMTALLGFLNYYRRKRSVIKVISLP